MMRLQRADPRLVGPYRLHRRLGAGGMGVVYLGADRRGQKVALKLIRPELAEDQEFRTRFAREVGAAARIRGGCIARLVASDIEAERPWLATSYVPGPSLYKRVGDDGPLPWPEVAAIGSALADGLVYVHDAGVVHRDLKPSNILLSPKGPRIIDFGIAWSSGASTLTHVGTAVGSPGFLAPEQVRGVSVTGATDVFALGSTLAYAACGDTPFGSGSSEVMLYRVVHEEPDLDAMPPALAPLIRACLAKEPSERPSPIQLRDELRELAVRALAIDRAAVDRAQLPHPAPPSARRAGAGGPSAGGHSAGGPNASGHSAGPSGAAGAAGGAGARPAREREGARPEPGARGGDGQRPMRRQLPPTRREPVRPDHLMAEPPAPPGPRDTVGGAGGGPGGAADPASGASAAPGGRGPGRGGVVGRGGGAGQGSSSRLGPGQVAAGRQRPVVEREPRGYADRLSMDRPERPSGRLGTGSGAGEGRATAPGRPFGRRGTRGPAETGTGAGAGRGGVPNGRQFPRGEGGAEASAAPGAPAGHAAAHGTAGSGAAGGQGEEGVRTVAMPAGPAGPRGRGAGQPTPARRSSGQRTPLPRPGGTAAARRRLLRQRLIVFITVTLGVALVIALAQGCSDRHADGAAAPTPAAGHASAVAHPAGVSAGDAVSAADTLAAWPAGEPAPPAVDWNDRSYQDPADGSRIDLAHGHSVGAGTPVTLSAVLPASYRNAAAAVVVLTRRQGNVPEDLIELYGLGGAEPVLLAAHASPGDPQGTGSWRIADGAVIREEHVPSAAASAAGDDAVSTTRYTVAPKGTMQESWPGAAPTAD